jgi:CrcB protein
VLKGILLVSIGGALGSALRYILSLLLNQSFPLGTLLVNVLGSFLIVIVSTLTTRGALSEDLRLMLATGVLGGFTTYSSFNYELLRFIQQEQYPTAFLYLFATLSCCLVGAFLAAWWLKA